MTPCLNEDDVVRLKICVLMLLCPIFCAHPVLSKDAPETFILDGLRYPLDHFPYKLETLPKDHWLGFAYAEGGKPVPCELVATSITVEEDEYYEEYKILPKSRVPGDRQTGFLLHGLDLQPGLFDCGRPDPAHNYGIRPGIDLAHPDPALGAGPKTLATFQLGGRGVDIVADKVSGKFRLLMQYGGQTQVLYEASPAKKRGYLQVDSVFDLDRDGKPDVIVSMQHGIEGWYAFHARLYLSSRAAPGKLVKEVAAY
jgi:hypothetical protein